MTHPSEEFDAAVAATCEGTASEAQLRDLAQVLREIPAARDAYLFSVELHARLASDDALFLPVEGVDAPDMVEDTKVVPFSEESRGWPIRLQTTRWLAAAACLTMIALLAGVFLAGIYSTVREPFARMVKSAGAEFEVGVAVAEGMPVRREAFKLVKGSVELTTARGASVVLEAPAEFRFESAQRLMLARGKAAAEVPPPAKGFTIITPSGEVVDLGTKFGVDVVADGASEVHVFKGEVIASAGKAAGRQSLKGEQALALHGGASAPRELRNAAFIHADELRELAAGLRAGRQTRWAEALAGLRRDPAQLAFLDLAVVPDGSFRWAQGRWPGTRAVEFTQPGDFLPVQFSGTTNELTLAAWVRLDRVPRAINSLLHTDGWGQPGQVHWMVSETQRMRLAIYDVRCVDQSVNRYPESSRLVTGAIGRWTHLAATYDASRRVARFYIDGEFDNEVPMLASVPAVLGPARVGNWNRSERILSGRLDELVLLKRVLSDQEIHALFAAGNPYPEK